MLRGLCLALACALLMLARVAHAQDASTLFAEGERAFAAGDYAAALRSFQAARAAGSAGASSDYNIGVCQYRLGDFDAAEATFATLAAQFPALRELAEYNRGLALRAAGRLADARVAFGRARVSRDDKIAALANAQLDELGAPAAALRGRWRGYVSGGAGYDDNVALVDELLLAVPQSSSSPLAEALGVATRTFAAPLRLDVTGYAVRYSNADSFDQSALRVALITQQSFGAWLVDVGPTVASTTLDGEGFEQLVGVDLRLRRDIGERLAFETRLMYDEADAGDAQFAYLEGSRRQLRLALEHVALARLRLGLDLEQQDRADPGVSPSRQRWSVSYRKRLGSLWTGDARLSHRDSRYGDADVPREERLLELSLGASRDLSADWTLGAEYRWSENDSTVPLFSYDAQRVLLSIGRSF
jgi:tetratricopeptide (TPR) repeat protein